MICREGEVHAIERSPDAVRLILRNRKKFGAFNLHVHEGVAPDMLSGSSESPALPVPTHVFVGGSGGRLGDILRYVAGLGAGIRVVASAVTLRTIAGASGLFMDGALFYDTEALSLSVARSRPLGGSSLMAAQNPVMLWSAFTAGDDEKM
jgi:precorrin-6Y C5,15-methyltransferase (decarboxylating)